MVDCREMYYDENWVIFLEERCVKEKIERGINLLCPDIESLEIQGQIGDLVESFIEVGVRACNTTKLGNECFDAAELRNHHFLFLPLHNVVDFLHDDQSGMIKYYLDKTNYLPIDSKMTQELDIFYQKTELLIEDNYMKLIAEEKQIDSQT